MAMEDSAETPVTPMAVDGEPLEFTTSPSATTEARVSRRRAMFASLKKHSSSSYQSIRHPEHRVGLCKDCYTQLYEAFPLTWLTDHGTLGDVERRAAEGSCRLCGLIARTIKEDSQMYEDLYQSHNVRIFHLSRFLVNPTTIAGGTFHELRVTANNREICQLLVTQSGEVKERSWFSWRSQSEEGGSSEGRVTEVEGEKEHPEEGREADVEVEQLLPEGNDLFERIDSMDLLDNGTDSEVIDIARGSIADSVAQSIPESIPETPELGSNSVAELDQEAEAAITPEVDQPPTAGPGKISRRKQFRQKFKPMRWSSTSSTTSVPQIEPSDETEDPLSITRSSRVDSQAIEEVNNESEGTEETKQSRKRDQLRQAFRDARHSVWKTKLANAEPYRSNWFEKFEGRRHLNFETVKFWISNCKGRHDAEKVSSKSVIDPVPIILIDVENECLVEADTSGEYKYLALSYQWGKKQNCGALETKIENYTALQEKGSLSLPENKSRIPPTFQDAMALTAKIGQRYVWIDRLCIKQDDMIHKRTNVGNMHLVYGYSLATIVKMTGSSAEDRLPGVQDDSRPPPCNVLHTEDRTVVCRHPAIGTLAEGASYESRGWTFQERLLAPRCIIFTNVEVFFLCGSGSMRETCNGGTRLIELPHAAGMSTSLTANPQATDPFKKYTESWKNFAEKELFVFGSKQGSEVHPDFKERKADGDFEERMLPTSFANHTLRALFEGFEAVKKDPEDPIIREKYMLGYFVTYRHLLRDYSRRVLSYNSDALKAWSGIATLLCRFGYDKEVVCGLPTAAMDLAIMWTPVGDALGWHKYRDQRKKEDEVDKYYPSWSWTSMTDPIDLLVSQRWCATGEGLAEFFRKKKQEKSLNLGDETDAWWKKGVQRSLAGLAQLDLGFEMSDECPFVSDVHWLGIQDGEEWIPIEPDQYLCTSKHDFSPREPEKLPSPPATEVLHFEANLVPITKFWRAGGRIITTSAKSWYVDIEQVMKQSTTFSLIRSLYQHLIGTFTNASWQEWRQIVPDRDQKELLNNMGFVYDELTETQLKNHHRNPELVKDVDKIFVVALSSIRAFPPTTFYWQYINKFVGSWVTPKKFREWGLTGGESWATKNVMLVNISEEEGLGRLARRICVGHVNAEAFRRAGPKAEYLKLC